MSTVSRPGSERVTRQGIGTIVLAETCRASRAGGSRGVVIAAVSIGILSGLAALAIFSVIVTDATTIATTVPIEVAVSIAGLALSLGIALAIGRTGRDFDAIALTFTPNRRRLFLGRVFATGLIGSAVGTVSSTVMVVVSLFAPAAAETAVAFAAVPLSAVAVATFAMIGHGAATLIHRPGFAILFVIGLVLVLPLALAAAGGVLPSAVIPLVDVLIGLSPTPLLFQAVAVSTVPTLGFGPNLIGIGGLVAWAVVLCGCAGLLFERRDA